LRHRRVHQQRADALPRGPLVRRGPVRGHHQRVPRGHVLTGGCQLHKRERVPPLRRGLLHCGGQHLLHGEPMRRRLSVRAERHVRVCVPRGRVLPRRHGLHRVQRYHCGDHAHGNGHAPGHPCCGAGHCRLWRHRRHNHHGACRWVRRRGRLHHQRVAECGNNGPDDHRGRRMRHRHVLAWRRDCNDQRRVRRVRCGLLLAARHHHVAWEPLPGGLLLRILCGRHGAVALHGGLLLPRRHGCRHHCR